MARRGTSKSSTTIRPGSEAHQSEEAKVAELLDPITPGEILLEEFLKPMGISQNRLARDIDVPVARINDIIHGRRGITADTALRLAKYFDITPEFWVNLQSRYDLKMAKRGNWPAVEKRIRPIEAAQPGGNRRIGRLSAG